MDPYKQGVLAKLDEAVSQNLVDGDAVPLLFILNSIESIVTTSSCSGRFQVIEVPEAGDKQGSRVLGKWHRKVSTEEVMEAVEKWSGSGELHLLVQPLLIHARCRDIGTAVDLRNISQACGLKFSTIRSLKLGPDGEPAEWGAVVEILGTERMEVPMDGLRNVVMEECIRFWVDRGNVLLDRTKQHMTGLSEALSESIQNGSWGIVSIPDR
ncbi:MAG: tRNA-wybutosine modification methyltransferase TYW3 [Thermoplasmatota archaeon]